DPVTGIASGTIVPNAAINPASTFYNICTWTGSQFRCGQYIVGPGNFDLSTATPITTAPVVTPPTGDVTYQRQDHTCLNGSTSFLYANPANYIGCVSGATFDGTSLRSTRALRFNFGGGSQNIVNISDDGSGAGYIQVRNDPTLAPAMSGNPT